MSKYCAIMQPTYLPWIGYFDLIDQVNQFVFLDDVQFVKQSWHCRNKIKTHQGELLLIIPIKKTKHHNETLLIHAEINYDRDWVKKHIRSLEQNYKKAPFFEEIYNFIHRIIFKKYKYLAALNIEIIQEISKKMGIKTSFISSSSLEGIKGEKDKRVVEICKKIDAEEYISPQGSAFYIEKDEPGGEITKNNIKLFYHNFEHPEYSQLHGGFISHLCILDLLFNYGLENSLEIIRKGRRPRIFFEDFRKTYIKKLKA